MAMTNVNRKIQDKFIQHQVNVIRYAKGLSKELNDILSRSNTLISKMLIESVGELKTSAALRRLNNVNRQIAAVRKKAWGEVDKGLFKSGTQFARQESLFTVAIYETESPVVLNLAMPDMAQIESMAAKVAVDGKSVSIWLTELEVTDLKQIQSVISSGIISGEPVSKIVTDLFGLDNESGISSMTRRNLNSIVKTTIQEIANEARSEIFKKNADVMDKEQFVATLDSRTTLECAAHDGELYNLGTGPKPPLHWNCRSCRIAYLDADVLFDRPAKPATRKMALREYANQNDLGKISNYNDLPYGSKTKFLKFEKDYIYQRIETIPETQTFAKWFKNTPEEFQIEYLGKTKYKLYATGKLGLDKFVDRNGLELTLKQLAAKHEDVFVAAGLNLKMNKG